MDKFEEYKFFAEDAQKLSERRQSTGQTCVTVNTAIFAVSALLIKDIGFRGWTLVPTALPLFLTGVLLCLIWQKIIFQHHELIGWRYDQLKEMEKVMAGSYQMYTKEWQDFLCLLRSSPSGPTAIAQLEGGGLRYWCRWFMCQECRIHSSQGEQRMNWAELPRWARQIQPAMNTAGYLR